MLRITITDTPTEQKWVLQGLLAIPWASELWANWTKARNAREGRQCVVDLQDVTFIDQSGESVLLAMMTEQVRFVASGVCTKQLLEDLQGRITHPLRKCMKYQPAMALAFAILASR